MTKGPSFIQEILRVLGALHQEQRPDRYFSLYHQYVPFSALTLSGQLGSQHTLTEHLLYAKYQAGNLFI